MRLTKKALREAKKSIDLSPESPMIQALMRLNPSVDYLAKRATEGLLTRPDLTGFDSDDAHELLNQWLDDALELLLLAKVVLENGRPKD